MGILIVKENYDKINVYVSHLTGNFFFSLHSFGITEKGREGVRSVNYHVYIQRKFVFLFNFLSLHKARVPITSERKTVHLATIENGNTHDSRQCKNDVTKCNNKQDGDRRVMST